MKVWLVQGETKIYGIISTPTVDNLAKIFEEDVKNYNGDVPWFKDAITGTDPYVGLVEFEVDQRKTIDT